MSVEVDLQVTFSDGFPHEASSFTWQGFRNRGDFLAVLRPKEIFWRVPEHAPISLEQLSKELGQVVSPDRPAVSTLCFLVLVGNGKADELTNKLTIAFQ